MKKFALGWIALTGVLAGAVLGQQTVVGLVAKPGPARHARYSASTCVWVEASTSLTVGGDVIYNNSCASDYYAPMASDIRLIDDGILPGPTNPGWSPYYSAGCQTSYRVSGLEIEYCTPLPWVDVEILFFDQRANCDPISDLEARANLFFPSLPGSSDGMVQCWRVQIDLDGGGANVPFDLPADGDGQFDGPWPGPQDRFGVTFRVTNAAGTLTGPSFASTGDCAPGAGTRWAPVIDYSQPGAGTGNSPFFVVNPPGGFSCHTSSVGNGIHLRLFASACSPPIGVTYCYGDGSGSACPCGVSSPIGAEEGCPNSLNGVNGARLRASGTASVSADSVTITVSGLPGAGAALLFQGTQRVAGGAGVAFGDGLRCVAESVLRLGVMPMSAYGQVTWPLPGDPDLSVLGAISSPTIRRYQVWYRNSAPFCTPDSFNLSNGIEIVWTG